MSAVNRRQDRDAAQLAASLVAYALGLSADAIIATGRGSPAQSHARHIAMYLMHVSFGVSLARVAYAFDRDRSTVAHGCYAIEDRRDDPDFDGWLEQLEEGLRSVMPLYRCSVAQVDWAMSRALGNTAL